MTEYKCPYCAKDSFAKTSKRKGKFDSWQCVRNHLSTCKLNTNTITIDLAKGPQLKPKLIRWSNEDIINKIIEFYKIVNRIPQKRDFVTLQNYPDPITVMKHFGSWNKAIETAGFTPNIQNGFGIDTYAKDNNLYRSTHEAYFVNHFLFEKEDYEYEKPYGNGWYYDFYLPKYDLYIELDGGLRPQRIEEKRKYHLTHGVNCNIINTQDIYKKDFKIF